MAEISARVSAHEADNFWRVVPIALLLWLLLIHGIGSVLTPTTPAPTPIAPVDARIVEVPDPPPIIPSPPLPKPQKPEQVKKIITPTPLPKPKAPEPVRNEQLMTAPQKSTQPSPIAEVPIKKLTPVVSDSGAQVLYQPIPQVPDDLRDEAINAVAMARFYINPDGTVRVELIKPTPNPKINQMILKTLRTWRFSPATQNGKPILSTKDIRVTVDVS